jgi:fermentation-respiration switch protein FrsA (DUF1100 family)
LAKGDKSFGYFLSARTRSTGFLERGLSLLLVEYPGYGRSAGKPSQRGIETVMMAAYDRLVARPDVDRTRIIAYGRSLGGGAACILAANRPIAALILQSSFISTREFAVQYWLPGILVRDPFDNEAVVQDYHGPILIMHGIGDKLIPVTHAKRLLQSAPNATLITYPCGHNDCPPSWDQFWLDVSAFLRQVGVIEVR